MRLQLHLAAQYEGFQLAAKGDVALEGVTALFGPSGAGKTTVLNVIAGFAPALGLVKADGAVWQGPGARPTPAHHRPVATVFQQARLFDHLSVDGNLAYAERRALADGPPIARGDVIEALDLAPLLARRPATLSGGEQKRVAIARALLRRPKLLLMDEPLSGLDRARKAAILPFLRALPGRFGTPVLFVSHIVEEVAQVADRLIVMKAGQFAGEGPVAPMLERLGADAVGHFEASALLEGTVAAAEAATALLLVDTAAGRLAVPQTDGVSPGDRIRLRIRNRDVAIALAPLDGVSIRNQLPARVAAIAPEEGAHAEVKLTAGAASLTARITRAAVADLQLKEGKEVVALVKSVAFDRRLG